MFAQEGVMFFEFILVAIINNNPPITLDEHRYQSAGNCASSAQNLESYLNNGLKYDYSGEMKYAGEFLVDEIIKFEKQFGEIMPNSRTITKDDNPFGQYQLIQEIKNIKANNYEFQGRKGTQEFTKQLDAIHQSLSTFMDYRAAAYAQQNYLDRLAGQAPQFTKNYVINNNTKYACLAVPSLRNPPGSPSPLR